MVAMECWNSTSPAIIARTLGIQKKNKKEYLDSCSKKIIAPQILDQSEGDKVCGPDQIDQSDYGKRMVGLIETISNQQVSAQMKIEVVQRAVATCPKVNMGCGRKRIPSLLDSGSHVTLICQSYFKQEILPHIRPSGGENSKSASAVSADDCQSWKTLCVHICLTRSRFFWGLLCQRWGSYYPRTQ